MLYVARRKTVKDDRDGIDYIVYRSGGLRPLFLDLKEVAYVPSEEDLILLETKMRGQNEAPGWAVDETKRTDLILIVRGDKSTVLLSARRVRAALTENPKRWDDCQRGSKCTPGFYEWFHSDYILIPRAELEAACDRIGRQWRN
jgi:hypothetical protein